MAGRSSTSDRGEEGEGEAVFRPFRLRFVDRDRFLEGWEGWERMRGETWYFEEFFTHPALSKEFLSFLWYF